MKIKNWKKYLKDLTIRKEPGCLLVGLRLHFNLSQNNLAKILRCNPKNICRFENNSRPITKKNALILEEFFKVPHEIFLTTKEPTE